MVFGSRVQFEMSRVRVLHWIFVSTTSPTLPPRVSLSLSVILRPRLTEGALTSCRGRERWGREGEGGDDPGSGRCGNKTRPNSYNFTGKVC